jgi:cytidylate kinase
MIYKSIVINGDLGSGKTTIARLIAERTGLRSISIGDLYREIAQRRGMSALELNLHAERDEEIDRYVDDLQRQMAESSEQLVVDSRLAWLFFRAALKVHLVTDPVVAAGRVFARPADQVESYSSIDEAADSLKSRSESERQRFITKYGVDKERLRNYDLICDTTRADPAGIADWVLRAYQADGRQPAPVTPALLLDPGRIYPTQPITGLRGLWDADEGFVADIGRAGFQQVDPITLGYTGSCFYVVDGHRRLSAALRNDFRLIPALLAAEREEVVLAGLNAERYFESAVTLSMIYDWNDAHDVRLRVPAHLETQLAR